MAQSGRPSAIFGNQCCFCSSVPPSIKALAIISGRVIRLPAPPNDPLESSSVTTIIPRLSSWSSGSSPPYLWGTLRPKQPNSLTPSRISLGIIMFSPCIRAASGFTTSSANWRKVSAINSFSSSSPRSPRSPWRSTMRLPSACRPEADKRSPHTSRSILSRSSLTKP